MSGCLVKRREEWLVLPFHRGPSELHFALSDQLVRNAQLPTVWWHVTDIPTLILGAGQHVDRKVVGASKRLGARIVKRHAGGTAVFAGPGVLGLDVVLPASHPLSVSDVVEAYRWLGEVWVDVLGRLGVSGHLVTIQEARDHRSRALSHVTLADACFGTLSPYEVTVNGRKLVGLAQVRRRGRVLFQAGMHQHFDAPTLSQLLSGYTSDDLTAALRAAATGLQDVGVQASQDELMSIFSETLERRLCVSVVSGNWPRDQWAAAADVAPSLLYHLGSSEEVIRRAAE